MAARESSHDSPRSLSDVAYEALKRDIIRLVFEPGDQVSEQQLIERYRVSRTTVRSALGRLVQEQFVTALPRQGYVIAPITLKQVHDLFAIRLSLEDLSARLAAVHITPDEINVLDKLCDVRYSPGAHESVEAFLCANAAFHLGIARASRNSYLLELLSGVHDKIERLLHLSHSLRDENEQTSNQHRQLLAALGERDPERAAYVMVEQIVEERRFLLAALIESPSLQTVNLHR